jgi:uncharacterized protein YbjQ (UPF0145 family)
MWKCIKCEKNNQDERTDCWLCGTGRDGTLPSKPRIPAFNQRKEALSATIILSTTASIPNHRITKLLGVVTGEAIIGANIFSDLFAEVRDVVGGRAGSYESKLKYARQIAINDMKEETIELGGNAVVGVRIDYESIRGSMLMVAVSGTAVFAEPDTDDSKAAI